jgi:two-component system sensor histidine kinase VicK
MTSPPIPINEKERLNSLKEYQILDTLPGDAYDDLTFLASQICDTPIALVSLIDTDRQWFKSKVGLEVNEISRDISFCGHAINNQQEIFEIQSASEDDRFFDNPLVINDLYFKFYAGIPLVNSEGFSLGTLCVIDTKPKKLSNSQKKSLAALSRQVMHHMELQRQLIKQEEFNEEVATKYRLLHTILSTLPQGVIALNEENKFLLINDSAKIMMGDVKSKISGLGDLYEKFETFHVDGKTQIKQGEMPAGRSMRGEVVLGMQAYIKNRKTGEGKYYSFDAKPLLGENKEIKGVILVASDISEQKEKEFELNKGEDLLLQAQDLANLGHWVVDLVKGTVFWSQETKEIHEVAEDYVPTLEGAINFYDEESKPIIKEAIQQAIAEKKRWDVKLGILTATKKHRWVRATGKPYEEDGKVTKLFGVFQDITRDKIAFDEVLERQETIKKLNADLNSVNAELEEFTYIATHDLKSPLAAIKGHVEIIENEVGNSNLTVGKSLLWIRDSIENAESKIESIISIARLKMEHGKNFTTVDIFKLLKSLKNNILPNYDKYIERFTIRMDSELKVETNKLYLETVLLNLIENAVKYRKHNQNVSIDISISKNKSKTEILVTDNGLGMDMEKSKVKLFKMFHRLHDHVEGSGIGLYLSSKMIENIGGKISVESTIGVGTTFKIVF